MSTQPAEVEEVGGLILPLSLVFLFVLLWVQLNSSWGSITGGEVTGWGSLRAVVPLLVLLGGAGMLLGTYVSTRAARIRRVLPLLLLGAFALIGMIAGFALNPSLILTSYWAAAYVAPLLVAGLLISRGGVLDARDLFHVTLAVVAAIATVLLVLFSVEARLVHTLLELDLYRVGSNYGNAPVQSLMINANGTGRFAAIIVLAASSLLFTARGWIGRGISMVAILAFGSLLIFTQSRGAILGFAFALFLLVGLHKGWKKAAGAYAIGLLTAGAFFQDEVLGYLSRGFDWTNVQTLTGRTRIWEDLWPHIIESPLIGWGFWADRLLVGQEAHNALAGALITSGIVGTAFFLAAWGIVWLFVTRHGLRSRFGWLGEVDRNAAILATAILGFLTVRAIPESTGTYFGVDLLILVPVMGFLYALKTDQLPGRGSDRGCSSSKKPRVLACAYACAPPGSPSFNGGETLLGWRLTEQIARRSDLTVLVSAEHRGSIEGAQLDAEARFVAVGLPSVLRPLRRLQGGIQLYAYLWQIKAYFVARHLHREESFDVFHHLTYANDWMASYLGAYLDIPYVRGPGGGAQQVPRSFREGRSLGFRFAQQWRSSMQKALRLDPVYRRSQDEAARLLVCTRESWQTFPKRWREKTELFPVNGIDPDAFPDPSGKEDEGFTVLSVGKLLEHKGFDLAIEAFARFTHERDKGQLVIIGDGPNRGRLERLVSELGIQDRVEFPGWADHDEVLQRMVDADIFLFTSLRDGGGAVVVEAMAAGTPVVCLAHAGPGYHTGGGAGFPIIPTEPEETIAKLATALKQLGGSEELRKIIGERGRERAISEYRWEDHGDRIASIYDEVLDHASAQSSRWAEEASESHASNHATPRTKGGTEEVSYRMEEPEPVQGINSIQSFDVLGTPISAVKPDDVLAFIDETVNGEQHAYVCVCSVNNVMSAREDEELARIHREAGMCVPDGFYLAKIGQRRHPGEVERIRGTDLTWNLAEHAAQEGYSIFLYGAAPGVPEQMAENLQEHVPGLEIAGTHSPPFRPTTPDEDAKEVAMINEADPDILLVGLPTPKQDRWMAEHFTRVEVNVMFGVGAAFDFVSGTKEQAPRWIRENGFEWLYRFSRDPRRLWKRVILQGPKFVSLLAADALRQGEDDEGSG